MTRAALTARLLTTIAAGVTLMLAVPSTVVGQEARDPFAAMSVHQPAQPVAAPELVFVTAEGREARLSTLRGSVVLLGFFTTT